MMLRNIVVGCLSAGLAATAALASSTSAGAVSSTIPITISSNMTLSTSTVEVEFPVTVTCDNIGAFDSYVFVHLQQDQNGATGSGEVRPLICDSRPHQYVVHVFADSTAFRDGVANASSVAQNIAPNFVEQDGSATATTTLAFGGVNFPATSVTSTSSGSTYTVNIDKSASLFGKFAMGGGRLEALIDVTVSCTPPTTSNPPFLTVLLEAPNGKGVLTGSNPSEIGNPQLTCDGTPHTYQFTVFESLNTGPPGGFSPGPATAAAYIENAPVAPQFPEGPNADAVSTVHLG